MRLRRTLELLAGAMARHHLPAVLVGTAAARLQGVPLRVRDLDWLWLDSAVQRRRLAHLADELGCDLQRPFYHRGLRWQLIHPAGGWRADFVCQLDGVRDPAALIARAQPLLVGAQQVAVATLGDVVRSKLAAARPRDRAVLAILEKHLVPSRPRS